ncbi:MAG TPA: hypothetical protein VMB18_13100 [Terriglobales bacterium]|nr:hypothetical protein [Terriglobales bacterium]
MNVGTMSSPKIIGFQPNRRSAAAQFVANVFFVFLLISAAMAQDSSQKLGIGPGNVVVHTALGGFILGYDIDHNGTEGLLAESVALPNGEDDAAIETFDQRTGKIVKIVKQQKNTPSDFVALGIFGNGTGLAEYQYVKKLFVEKTYYGLLNPLSGNKITGMWTPPIKGNTEIIAGLAESQGSANTAVLGFHNTINDFSTYVFSSNVAANTFGPVIKITDTVFDFDNSPVMAYDSATNQAVLGGSNGCFGCTTEIGLVDLATGEQTEFPGLGFGFVNGIAVDPATGIACTTTEDDFSVEFYNLKTQKGIIVQIPGATSQAQSGLDVELDPIHKLFLVGQEFTSTGGSGSSIQVFDEQGNYVESINGLSLPASSALIALHPSERAGYVIVTPELTSLQSFTY